MEPVVSDASGLRFLEHIATERRLSPRTVTAYTETLSLYERYLRQLPEARSLTEADGDNLRDWMETLIDTGHSAAYVNRSLSALKTFYRHCLKEGIVARDPAHAIQGPKKPRRLPEFMKEGEMERLLERLDAAEDTYYNTRTRTIIYTLYHTGLRASELLSLDDRMVDLTAQELRVTGKRDKQRMVPFGTELRDVISRYKARRDAEVTRQAGSDALFVTERGGRMTYGELRCDVRGALALVTTRQRRSPHILRHTFATAMLNHEANLESIRQLLGHQSLDTTEIYTHTTFEQLRRTYNEAHPRA